jgi:hypothetical protein
MGSVEQEQTPGRRRRMDIRRSRGETVIDYGIVNEEAWERVKELRIEERAESDHLEVALRKRRRRKEQRRKRVEIGMKLFIFISLE